MMDLTEIANKVDIETFKVPVQLEGGEEKIEIAAPTKGDWIEIKKVVGSGVWERIMDLMDAITEGADEASMIKILNDLDDECQLEMWCKSLQRVDPNVSREDVDKIVSHGIDLGNYVQAIIFMVVPRMAGEQPELAEEGGSGNPLAEANGTDTTEDER